MNVFEYYVVWGWLYLVYRLCKVILWVVMRKFVGVSFCIEFG